MSKPITNTYTITEPYKAVSLYTKNASVRIERAKDETTSIAFIEDKKRPYDCFVENGTLTVKLSRWKWYNLFHFCCRRAKITVCLPKEGCEELSISCVAGRVAVEDLTCKGDIDIQTTAGKIHADNVSCKAFTAKGNTAEIMFNHLSAGDRISIKNNTGGVALNDCRAREIFVRTNTGNVSGKLSPNTAFVCKTNTGKIAVPSSTVGEAISGSCEIKTNTGNIQFE